MESRASGEDWELRNWEPELKSPRAGEVTEGQLRTREVWMIGNVTADWERDGSKRKYGRIVETK
jgi:hypothetical protein